MSFIEDILGNPEVEILKNRETELLATIRELRDAAQATKDDLLERAETDSQGYKVVNLGSSVWRNLKQALDNTKDIK